MCDTYLGLIVDEKLNDGLLVKGFGPLFTILHKVADLSSRVQVLPMFCMWYFINMHLELEDQQITKN